jgi:hypothetical protein
MTWWSPLKRFQELWKEEYQEYEEKEEHPEFRISAPAAPLIPATPQHLVSERLVGQ